MRKLYHIVTQHTLHFLHITVLTLTMLKLTGADDTSTQFNAAPAPGRCMGLAPQGRPEDGGPGSSLACREACCYLAGPEMT